MQINKNHFINNTTIKTQPSFQAKFFHSQALEDIVKYAVEKEKFDQLNISRKMIDSRHLKARLLVDLSTNEQGCPVMTITKYLPNRNITTSATLEDYHVAKVSTIETTKKMNPLKFGLEKLIKMGNNFANNKLFERIVLRNTD